MNRNRLTKEQAEKFALAMKQIDWRNKQDRVAFAQEIVEELREEITMDPMEQILGVDRRVYGEGQSLEFVTRKGLKAYVHEPGSYAPRSTITNKVQTLSAELVSVNVEMELGQLRAGRHGAVEDIRRLALEALQGRKNAILWNTLIGSVTSAGANYFSVANTASAAAKKNALDSGLDYALDVQGSTAVAIIARRQALTWLADYTAYNTYGPSEARKQELDNSPYPASYKGIPIVYLNQYTDAWNGELITENNIMILGTDTLKLGVERELDFEEDVDSNTLMWNIHFYEKYGLGVFFPLRNAKIVLT